MCAAREILLKNVRGKGNPIEILEKTSQSEPHPSPHLRKSWKKPRNLSPVLAPTAGTPGNPGKKPHNLRTIPWTAGNPGKKPHNLRTVTGTAGNPGKKPHNITDLLVGC